MLIQSYHSFFSNTVPLRRRQQIGLSLVEVLITLVILSIGSLAVLQLQIQSLESALDSQKHSRDVLQQGDTHENFWINKAETM